MNKLFFLFKVLLISSFTFAASAEIPKEGVYFANLKDGQIVKSPFKVQMGIAGKTLAPAGELKEGTGHHHIIVDGSYIAEGNVVPADATHLHFGKAQTETELTLTPGQHTLTLQLADGGHKSYGEKWAKMIGVLVE